MNEVAVRHGSCLTWGMSTRDRLPTLREAEAVLGRRNPFTVPETADYFNVSTRTIWALLKQGKLQKFKVGRRVTRVTIESVEAFEAEARVTS